MVGQTRMSAPPARRKSKGAVYDGCSQNDSLGGSADDGERLRARRANRRAALRQKQSPLQSLQMDDPQNAAFRNLRLRRAGTLERTRRKDGGAGVSLSFRDLSARVRAKNSPDYLRFVRRFSANRSHPGLFGRGHRRRHGKSERPHRHSVFRLIPQFQSRHRA